MDLHACAKRHLATAGTYDYPHGDAIRLRTGRALARRGLVEVGNRWSANRYTRWRPTSAGIALVKAVLELGWHPSWRKSY